VCDQNENQAFDPSGVGIPREREGQIIDRVAGHMAGVMRELHMDLDDPNFEGTPERVAKMYLEMFHGLFEGSEPKVTTFPNY